MLVLRLSDREKQAAAKVRPDGSLQVASYRESGRVFVSETRFSTACKGNKDCRNYARCDFDFSLTDANMDSILQLAPHQMKLRMQMDYSLIPRTMKCLFMALRSMPRSIERRKLLRISVATSGTKKQRHFLTARLVLVNDCLSSPRHCRGKPLGRIRKLETLWCMLINCTYS